MKNCHIAKVAAITAIAGGISCLASIPAMAFGFTSDIDADKVLFLNVDVSGSIDATEYSLVIDGYENAFRNSSAVRNGILNYSNGTAGNDGIVVGLLFWASQQEMLTDGGNKWFHLTDTASIDNFADVIANSSRPTTIGGGTNLAGALDRSRAELNALFTGNNQTTGAGVTVTNNKGKVLNVNLETIIDISSDGYHDRATLGGNGAQCDDNGNGDTVNGNTAGTPNTQSGLAGFLACQSILNTAIDAVLTNGPANRINALPIVGSANQTEDRQRYRDLLDTYYETGLTVTGGTIGPVIGGDGNEAAPAFVEVANDFGDFGASIEQKLAREISEVPFEFSPALGLLLSGGIFGGLHWRKRRKTIDK